MEHRTPFKATLNAIHMLPALHRTFHIHTYIHVHVHDDSNYLTDKNEHNISPIQTTFFSRSSLIHSGRPVSFGLFSFHTHGLPWNRWDHPL